MKPTKQEQVMDVKQANILVHSRMADSYNEREPHFREENRTKVKKVLTELRQKSPGGKLLDIGCGTGFIIDLARDIFERIDGVDITEDMLGRVDTSPGNIHLHQCSADQLPFANESFDVVTSYAFLHHLEDYSPVFLEIFRVLKRGGIFYIDLEPNALFWELATRYDTEKKSGYSAMVQQEINSVCHTDARVLDEYGIPEDVFNTAEYIKSIAGGIRADRLRQDALDTGFRECEISYQWFPGQGRVMHGQSEENAAIIENYLRELLPLSSALFKYIRFVLVK
jgi:ubiquinone/menaquinone biosynthesis C-methylase UbiE